MILLSRALAVPKAMCLVIFILTFSEISYAQEDHKRNGWWGGIEAGLGYVELSLPEGNETDPHFYLGFSGGYSINP